MVGWSGPERVVMPLVLDAGVEPIPGYLLVRPLGRGGFGEVWEATAPGAIRVALKFIRLDTEEAGSEQRALEVIRDIRHPHLLDVQFAIRVDDCLVIAMPLCDENLMQRLGACQARGLPGVPRDELLSYMEELAHAIDFLNEPRLEPGGGGRAGAQHRDIKPHNIFLVGDSVRLADFVLAKILAGSLAGHSGSMSAGYVAPEVIEGRVSQRSDQYSLAVTYAQLRTGQLPFAGDSLNQILYARIRMPPDLGDLPEEERAVVARALEKRPEDRWPNCRAFVLALAEAVHTEGGRLAPQGGSTLVAGARARILKLLTRWRFVNPSGPTLVADDQTTPMTKCVTRLPQTQRRSPPGPGPGPGPGPVLPDPPRIARSRDGGDRRRDRDRAGADPGRRVPDGLARRRSRRRRRREAETPGADRPAVPPRRVRGDAGAVRAGHGPQPEPARAGGGVRQEGGRPGHAPAPGRERLLARRGRILQRTERAGRAATLLPLRAGVAIGGRRIPPADGGGVGIRLSRGEPGPV